MTNNLKINEIFSSIQGEGRYVGYPVLFIRMSGCNKHCAYCDTSYHVDVKLKLTPLELADKIIKHDIKIVVWTGGEPMLQYELIQKTIICLVNQKYFFSHHLETNGTILNELLLNFDYICFSPKNLDELKTIIFYSSHVYPQYDIKIVTDLNKIGVDMLEKATIVMPLTIGDNDLDVLLCRKVWNYCIKYNKRFGMRLHQYIWNGAPGI